VWRSLVAARARGAVLGCSTPSVRPYAAVRRGVLSGRVYAILDAFEEGGDSRPMVRLFNPWGRRTSGVDVGQEFDRGDDEGGAAPTDGQPHGNSFCMAWADVVATFSRLHLCHIVDDGADADAGADATTRGTRVRGQWAAVDSGAVAPRPSTCVRSALEYAFTVADEAVFFVAQLSQLDTRWQCCPERASAFDCNLFPVNLVVTRVTPEGTAQVTKSVCPGSDGDFRCLRDVARAFVLPKGVYNVCLAAHPSACGEPFTLSLASSSPVALEASPSTTAPHAPPEEPLFNHTWDGNSGSAGQARDTAEYAASLEIQGLQRTVGTLTKSVQELARDIGELSETSKFLASYAISRGAGGVHK
jgi:hypothetical protein